MILRTITNACWKTLRTHAASRRRQTRALSNKAPTSDVDTVVQYILDNTEISCDHLTPELPLRLITENCRLWGAREPDPGYPEPFWGFYWPGGQALTRYIMDHPELIRGKTVLDVGSGCGASAVAAKVAGAAHVVANDICSVAAEAISLNASLNGKCLIEIVTDNLIGCIDSQWDVVLFGDMFYDFEFTNQITEWLTQLSANDLRILIGDPGRMHFLNHPITMNLQQMAQYELLPHNKEENNGLSHGYVWKFTSDA